MDFANLFIHDMKIIDQPLRRWRDDLFFADGFGNGAIGLEQHPTIISEPRPQRSTSRGFHRDALSSCKAFCMLFEPFDAKQFAPNRLFSILSPRTPEGAKYGMLHYWLST
jgi:hypothetical protein